MISILLAAYNGEKYLPAQLASLSAQTKQDFEVIWQDDGSVDRTSELLSDWSKRDVRFHPGQEQGLHLGAAGNFISLLHQAKGDQIFFCDQDDFWEPEKVERLFQTGISPASDFPLLVHSDAVIIDGEDHPLAPSFFRLQGWDPGAVHLNQLLVQNNATGCMMMLNRPLANLVIQHGHPERMFMHDWFVALTAAAFGKIIFLDRPLTRYRQHGDNKVGASQISLVQRGLQAIHERDKAKARIALTYSHARAFQEAYGDLLPPEAARTVDAYLATESMPKLKRLHAIRAQGNLMQSPVTRVGQFLFG